MGAKQMNTELSLPCGFWAVPVLPQMFRPRTYATLAVAPSSNWFTAFHIPRTIFGKWTVSTSV